MIKKKLHLTNDTFLARLKVYSALICIVTIAILLGLSLNLLRLNKILEQVTARYMADISFQLSNNISMRLHYDQVMLMQMTDSIKSLFTFPDKSKLQEFLVKESGMFNFDLLMVFDRSGNSVSSSPDIQIIAANMEGVRDAFAGKNAILYVEDRFFHYSVPIYNNNGEIAAVLSALRSQDRVKKLLYPEMSWTNSVSCVVSSAGTVVVPPADYESFLLLARSLLEAEKDSKSADAVNRMKADIRNQESGIFHFRDSADRHLLMAYHSLFINDWILLTFVPEDVISQETLSFVFESFIFMGCILIIFLVLFVVFVRIYSSNITYLKRWALSDPLTKGMNNICFQREYGKLTQSDPSHAGCIVLLNIKNFKIINENLGMPVGNQILQCVHSVLCSHIDEGEFVCREEADNFFLQLKDTDEKKIRLRIDVMIRDINFTLQSCGYVCLLQFYCGCYIPPYPAADIAVAQDRARLASRNGNGEVCVFYSDNMLKSLNTEQELNRLFLPSLENHDFQVFLQPKVRLSDGEVLGAEALVRWFHPEKGLIYPSDFIPLFERNGNICQLDFYVFEQVCAFLDRQRREGAPPITVSVNLSRKHLYIDNFLDKFFDIAERYRIPAGSIDFELTESIAFEGGHISLIQEVIRQMHAHGFSVSIDDFGVGYSSLALLRDLEADTIKLDKQFFDGAATEKGTQVVTSFIELAKKLDMVTVAEGIETEEQLAYLKDAGCDMVQGYVFSKPLSIPDFEKWLEGRRGNSSV